MPIMDTCLAVRMDVLDKVAPKGTRAVLVYRAMVEDHLAAAPEVPGHG